MRILNEQDSCNLASLHDKAFKNFFLTSLGSTFLSTFYKSIMEHSNGIAVGLFENNRLQAFAVGTNKKSGFYKEILKRNFLKLLIKALPSIFSNPFIVLRLIKAFTCDENTDSSISEQARLLSIAVNPELHEKGYGTQILHFFEKIAFENSKIISLTTDSDNNDKANKFYLRNKYELKNTFHQNKRKMNLYVKQKL